MKILHVVGARPNFMKVAPILRALSGRSSGAAQLLVHTGQHYDDGMSRVFFEELEIPDPDVNLEVGSGSHAWQTAQVMLRFEPVLAEFEPDWVVVVGDVNSTLACTLVAVKRGARVAHVEAGLRSFDRTMPEEINRVLTDAVADLLFTPSADADENLLREGVPGARIRLVGNVMIDSLCHALPRARGRETHRRLGVTPGEFLYLTLHRPSNVDARPVLEGVVAGLLDLARRRPVVFAVHPRTRGRLREFGLLPGLEAASALRLLEPLGYLDNLCLTDAAGCVLTDSGGLQEETTYLGVPCLTLRPHTERPITLTRGTNRLTTVASLARDVEEALERRRAGTTPSPPPLWDGRAAERIVDGLVTS